MKVLALLSASSLAKHRLRIFDADYDMGDVALENIDWAIKGLHGFMNGIQQGFYSDLDFPISDLCMGEQTQEGMRSVMDYVQYGSLDYLFEFIENFATVANDNFYECEQWTILADSYFAFSDETFDSYWNNFYHRLYPVLAQLSETITSWHRPWENDSNNFEE